MIHSSDSDSSETSDEQKSTRHKSRLKHPKKNNTTSVRTTVLIVATRLNRLWLLGPLPCNKQISR